MFGKLRAASRHVSPSMNKTFLLLLGICLCIRNACSGSIQTTHGPVEGVTNILFNGKSVDAFLGIPFAAPPIGEKRFAPPQPLEPWKKTLRANYYPNSCFQAVNDELRQFSPFVSNSNESEDCLYLNLWRPTRRSSEKLAVMIWIYGGAFFAGSNSIPQYNGQILATENNVIVVSMNYRLSAFGFLFLNSSEVPGNAGLQDQIQAIKWVKANAKAFGGDPTRITLFGHSAGSIAIAGHMTNPDLYGLFQRGIMMSGPIDLATLPMSAALNSSLQAARKIGCPISSSKETLDCLRTRPVTDFFNNQQGIPPYILLPYSAVKNGVEFPIDTTHAAQNVSPRKRKDLIGGTLPAEANFFITSFFPGKVLNDDFTVTEDDLRKFLGIVFRISDTRLQDVILHEYGIYLGMNEKNQFREETGKLITDFIITCPQVNFTEEWVNSDNQVYYYSFEHRPSKAIKVPAPEWAGAVHGDEVPFVFGLPLDPELGYSVEEMKLSKKMMKYWSNFAKTGDPNGTKPKENIWPKLGQKPNLNFLRINENLTVIHSLKETKCTFWREIYPLLLSIQGKQWNCFSKHAKWEV